MRTVFIGLTVWHTARSPQRLKRMDVSSWDKPVLEEMNASIRAVASLQADSTVFAAADFPVAHDSRPLFLLPVKIKRKSVLHFPLGFPFYQR